MSEGAREELGRLGEALGGLAWVQGPGGNVSVKDDRVLYVKASGVRLRDVRLNVAAVPLDDAVLAKDGDTVADGRVFANRPRPSLETYFHALGPRVVAHTHALGVLLFACARERFATPDAVVLPYERPGRGIAVAIESAFAGRDVSGAVVLESHGLVVYAESVDAAVTTSLVVDTSLRRAFAAVGVMPREPTGAEADALAGAARAVAGGFACALPERAPSRAYLFPDAVVYASRVEAKSVDDAMAAEALSLLPRPTVLTCGSLRRAVAKTREQLAYAVEVALAHDWVEDALAPAGLARALPDDEPAKILDLPAEKYRLSLT